MPANKPTSKLSYIAIMLVAAGCLLLYFIRANSGPKPAVQDPPKGASGNAARSGSGSESVMISGDSQAILKAIHAGMNVNAVLTTAPHAGLCPLHVAASRNLGGVIPALAGAGAAVDAQAPDGRTPLMIASLQGFAGSVADLISANASVDLRDAKGQTALMLAAGTGKADVVQMLLKAGASINAADSSGSTAVAHAAAMPANAPVVSILITAGGDADVADSEGVTPLMKAAEHADSEQVVLLLNAGALPTGKSRDGRSALDRAKSRTDERGRQVAGVLDQAGS